MHNKTQRTTPPAVCGALSGTSGDALAVRFDFAVAQELHRDLRDGVPCRLPGGIWLVPRHDDFMR